MTNDVIGVDHPAVTSQPKHQKSLYRVVQMNHARASRILNGAMDYALILAIIYNSNSLWALAPDRFSLSCLVLGFVGIVYLLWCWQRHERCARYTGYAMCALMAVAAVSQLILAIAHGAVSISGTWFQYMLIIPVLLGCILMRGKAYIRQVFLTRLVWVAAILAALSVLLWFASSFLGLPPTHAEMMRWAQGSPSIYSYSNVYYNVQDAYVMGVHMWRNSSIFNEPPIASAFFGTVLALDLYLARESHWPADLCIVGALITSLSTGGVLYTIMLLVPLLWKALWHIRRKSVRKGSLAGTALLSLMIVAIAVRMVKTKIATSYSGQMHLLDFIEGMRIWWERPWVGFGLDGDAYIWAHFMSTYRDGLGYTSGLLFLLIHGGIVLGIFLVAPFVMMVAGSRHWDTWWVAVFLLVMLTTAAVQNCAFFLFAAAYGYASFIWRYQGRVSSLRKFSRG